MVAWVLSISKDHNPIIESTPNIVLKDKTVQQDIVRWSLEAAIDELKLHDLQIPYSVDLFTYRYEKIIFGI
jgi:hypothetical protein